MFRWPHRSWARRQTARRSDQRMPFKSLDDILKPDPRFADLCVVQGGIARRMTLADHHGAIAGISISDAVPDEVGAAFDRARNTVIYAFFDYDLFVVGEVQAFGAFELALKHRLNGHGGAARGTLRNLVDRARKAGILPALRARSHSGLRPYRGSDRSTKWIVSWHVRHPLAGNGTRGRGCLRFMDRSRISVVALTGTLR